MNRPVRRLAALLALLALTAYLGGAWTSLCTDGGAAHAQVAAADAGSHPAGHEHHAPEGPADREAPDGDHTGCPTGMLGAGSSCVAASLPAPRLAITAGATVQAAAPLFVDLSHDRLTPAAHFRPPRV